MKLWEDVSGLSLTEVNPLSSNIDINLQFSEIDHGDGYNFDGPGMNNCYFDFFM